MRRTRSMWARQAWAVFRKDITLEVRTKVNVNAMLFFAGTVLLIFSFALGPDPARLQSVAPGLLWLTFIFAGLLAVGRSYALESENGAFEGLLLTANNRSAIYAGKLCGAAAVMIFIEAVILPLMAVFYNIDLWSSIPALLVVGVLGTLGFSAIGALYGALTMTLRTREVLLPLLMLPVTVPVVLGAVKATTYILSGQYRDVWLWIEVLVAFDIVFITAGLMLYDGAVGE